MARLEGASRLRDIGDLNIRPRSVARIDGAELGLVVGDGADRLAVIAPKNSPVLDRFEGTFSGLGGMILLLGPTDVRNAAALRKTLPYLSPKPLGPGTSAGFGDRLGLATPGHVRAMRSAGGEVKPIFAQQSIREMERTNRSPREVLDDAMWGAFAEGWTRGFGADADHLKTTKHVDDCVDAGYTFFTFDPGEYVNDDAESVVDSALRAAFEALPWEDLEDRPEDLKRRYEDEVVHIEGHRIYVDRPALMRSAVKYGRAVVHAVRLYRHLESTMAGRPFEVEVSVDETESPTSHAQHLYVAREMRRLGVRWVSLAPRYVGDFEKGVDYMGEVSNFEADVSVHAAIARTAVPEGPYKLSLHSGSDKFSVYPAFVRQTRGLAHLKTAGTSYLEALRVFAEVDASLFREIYTLARERFEADRTSYHVSAEIGRAPAPLDVPDENLAALLEQFDAREILHVTFGSVLGERSLRERMFALLRRHDEIYAAGLKRHFVRHLEPFARKGST